MADKMMRIAGRAENGQAKAIKTDENGVVEVGMSGVIGSRSFDFDLLNETIPAGERVVVVTNNNPTLLEWLVFSTDSEDLIIIIYKKSDSGLTPIGDIFSQGGDSIPFSPKRIAGESSGFFKINIFEESNYKFTLDREIRFPEGIEIQVRNPSDSDVNVAVRGSAVVYK